MRGCCLEEGTLLSFIVDCLLFIFGFAFGEVFYGAENGVCWFICCLGVGKTVK